MATLLSQLRTNVRRVAHTWRIVPCVRPRGLQSWYGPSGVPLLLWWYPDRTHRKERDVCATPRIFFVTVNLRRAIATFGETEYDLLAKAIRESRRKLHFLFLGYVLMPDHWHALIWPAFPLTISRVVQDSKWNSARSLNQERHSSGLVWQHQFWDRFVRHAQEFRERLDYMHLNPVRKGFVQRPQDWRWSSYNNFGLDKEKIKHCAMQIDYVHLPESYRG